MDILVIGLVKRFSKELSKEHSKKQNFCTRIGPLHFVAVADIAGGDIAFLVDRVRRVQDGKFVKCPNESYSPFARFLLINIC